jgi:hypothetical protein
MALTVSRSKAFAIRSFPRPMTAKITAKMTAKPADDYGRTRTINDCRCVSLRKTELVRTLLDVYERWPRGLQNRLRPL